MKLAEILRHADSILLNSDISNVSQQIKNRSTIRKHLGLLKIRSKPDRFDSNVTDKVS